MVKQILFVILAALMVTPAHAALTSSNVPVHTHASVQQGGSSLGAVNATSVTATGAVSAGSIATSGTLSATKACATGFLRVTPNFCSYVAGLFTNSTTLPSGAACTATAALSGVADAKAVLVYLTYTINSNNAVAQRDVSGGLYPDATCAGQSREFLKITREEVAAVAGTTLVGEISPWMIVRSTATGVISFTTNVHNGGTGTGVTLRFVGYFD